MNTKKILILIFLLAGSTIAYLLISKYNVGYVDNMQDLEKKFHPLCRITNFKTTGNLLFVKRRQWSTSHVIVFGKFQDDIDVFKKDPRSKYINQHGVSSSPIFVPDYAYDRGSRKAAESASQLHIMKLDNPEVYEEHYRLLDDQGNLAQSVYIYGFIDYTSFWFYVDPVSNNFVLTLSFGR